MFGTLARASRAASLSIPLILGAAQSNAVEIEYWQYFFKERVEAINALIEEFEAQNPDITVKHTDFPYAQYRTKVAAAIPAGQGPDVVQLYYGWLQDYLKADLLVPLPEGSFNASEVETEYFPIVTAMKSEAAYWGMPTAVRSLALFYNKKLFEEAGLDPNSPPKTHDEMIEMAKKITKRDDGGNLLVAGLTAAPTSQDHHWWREVLVRQFGGQPYSDDNCTVAYNDDAGRAALQAYVDLFNTHKVTDYGFMDESQAAFAAGRAGMHIDGSFRLGTFTGVEGLDWAVAPLPTHNGVTSNFASYWVNGISKKAQGEKLDAAVKFLQFITTKEAMQLWVETVGELPARKDAALTDENRAHPLYGPFIEGLDGAHTTDFYNESAQRQVFLDMIDRIQISGMSVADSLAAGAAEEQKILDEFCGT
jgi:multiple sugar transport system substrate-binding protein